MPQHQNIPHRQTVSDTVKQYLSVDLTWKMTAIYFFQYELVHQTKRTVSEQGISVTPTEQRQNGPQGFQIIIRAQTIVSY